MHSYENIKCTRAVMPRQQKISGSEPQNLVKNFLIKNLFPKKEKKNL